jgi:hypothetical protein
MEEEDEQMQKLMAVPSELLAQMVQSNTDLTRCVTRLMEYLPTIQPPHSPPTEDDVNTCPYHDVSTPSIFGTIVNMLVIAALFFWFMDIFRMY